MKLTEPDKNVLLTLCEILEKSTQTNWEYGDLGKFRDWALRMRASIDTVSSTLRALIENSKD